MRRLTHIASAFGLISLIAACSPSGGDDGPSNCAVTRLVEGRQLSPSAVALFFTADDCNGDPLTGLTEADFQVKENGSPLSVEAAPTILRKDGVHVFTWLVLDMSSSTAGVLDEVIAGAKLVVNTLQAGAPVHIGVIAFAGDANATVWQEPTLDTPTLLSRIDELTTFVPQDPSSTNLYGAIITALTRSAQAQQQFRDRNYGGAFTTGYLIAFTDGKDTAGLYEAIDVLRAEGDSPDQVLAVGLQTADLALNTLDWLAPFGRVIASDATDLQNAFSQLAARIQRQVERSYLLGYCSPKRNGQHTVTVEVRGVTNTDVAGFEFNATGFGPGCTVEFFTSVCDGLECGGLGCGACDDRVAACNPATNVCEPL